MKLEVIWLMIIVALSGSFNGNNGLGGGKETEQMIITDRATN